MNNELDRKSLDRWIQNEPDELPVCRESDSYCGKCPRSSCLYLMFEAFMEMDEE